MKVGTIIRNNWTTTKNPGHIAIYIGNNKSIYPYRGKLIISKHFKGFQKEKTYEGKLVFEPVGFCNFQDEIKKSYDKYMEMDKVDEIGQSAKTKQLIEKLEKAKEKHEKDDEHEQSIGLDEVIEVVELKVKGAWFEFLQQSAKNHALSEGYENICHEEAIIEGIKEGLAIIEGWENGTN